jgi:hypothetical protein
LRSPTLFSEAFEEEDGLEVDKSENTKTFLKEDGTYETKFYADNFTYTDENGREKDIEGGW